MNTIKLSDRLDEAMHEAGFNQRTLSNASKVPQPTISRILKGTGKKGPETDNIRKLAKACNVNFEWLATGAEPKRGVAQPQNARKIIELDDKEDQDDAVKIRKVEIKLSAGVTGFTISEEVEDGNPIFFRKDWLASRGLKSKNLIALTVHGESMEPGLYDGDTVVINTADTSPADGEVFAINYEGENVIKRMIRDAQLWWLSSDNPDKRKHSRKACNSDYCIIIGRVIHKQSERI